MTRLKKISLFVLTAVVFCGAAAAGIYFYTAGDTMDTNTAANRQTNSSINTNANANVDTNRSSDNNANSGAPNSNTNSTSNITPKTKTDIEDQSDVLRLARIFLEHYGTYSNRNNFENITSVEAFMTDRFVKESAAFISSNKNNPTPDEYYGITTAVVSLNIEEYARGESARVRLGTRRQEMKGDDVPTTITQYALVALKYVKGNWKIDGVTWE